MKKIKRQSRVIPWVFWVLLAGLGSGIVGGPCALGASTPESSKIVNTQDRKTEDGKYFLNFKAASLINVLNVLSNLSGINFVAGREVADRQVNMTLENVGLDDVLQSIAYGSNVAYDFLPTKNIYLFRAAADSPERSQLVTRVYKLYYARVSEVREIDASSTAAMGTTSGSSSSGSSSSSSGGSTTSGRTSQSGASGQGQGNSDISKAIEKILSERGKVSIDERSNSLVITDSEDRLKMIEAALVQLDRPLDQVLINVLLVETFSDLDHELGIQWGDANGVFGTVYGGKENTTFPFFTKAGSNNSVGDWATHIGNQFSPNTNTDPLTGGPLASTATSGIRDFSSFQISVKAMESASKLKILAKPKILALDNQPALIKISTQAAIGTTTTTAATAGGSISSSIERSEVGTILRVTPLINTGDRITLTLEPTFATVDKSSITVSSTVGETGDPTVRTARTTMMVNDGQTIAIGGLLLSQQANGNRKVPFFGNLPVIGKAFFTSNTKTLQDRELILFVTPYIIRDPSMLETPSVPDDRMRYENEIEPFWKVKQKSWYKQMKEGPPKAVDFDSYFNVRNRLMNETLGNLEQSQEKTS